MLIYLLTTPPHLKYVATLPCDLPLMACFADINVSQSNSNICKVRWDVENFLVNRLRFDRIMVKSLWPRFLAHPVHYWSWNYHSCWHQTCYPMASC